MEEKLYTNENSVSPETRKSPDTFIKESQMFFSSLGLHVKPDGFIDPNIPDEKLNELKRWVTHYSKPETDMSQMPTEESFYRQVYLAVSLAPQIEDGKITYLMGKGAGAEIASLGIAVGRDKRKNVTFPYRSHSDFELYGTDENTYLSTESAFWKVFGGQESRPGTKTMVINSDYMRTTAQEINFGGIIVLVPELEILFLDKWLGKESKPREFNEGHIYDAEILAEQYVLDKQKIIKYLKQFVIQLHLDNQEKNIQQGYNYQIESLQKQLMDEQNGHTIESRINYINENLVLPYMKDATRLKRGLRIGGINLKYWVPFTAVDVNEKGEIINQTIRDKIYNFFKTEETAFTQHILNWEKEINELFEKIAHKYPNT